MRTSLAAIVLVIALLSGCSGTSDETGTNTNTGGATGGSTGTGSDTTPGNTTVPGETTLECTTQVGATGNANVNNQIGGCVLSDGLKADSEAVSLNLASGCVGWYDSTPGDSMTEGEFQAGDRFVKDTTLGVYCDATMAPNSQSSIVIRS